MPDHQHDVVPRLLCGSTFGVTQCDLAHLSRWALLPTFKQHTSDIGQHYSQVTFRYASNQYDSSLLLQSITTMLSTVICKLQYDRISPRAGSRNPTIRQD
jgi:hypothetical protein